MNRKIYANDFSVSEFELDFDTIFKIFKLINTFIALVETQYLFVLVSICIQN